MSYAQWVEALRNGLSEFTEKLLAYLPHVLGAVLLFALGWLLGRLASALVRRLARGLDRLLGGAVVDGALKRLGVGRPAPELLGGIVFWAVFLLFATAATEALGLPVVATWIGSLSYYLPRVLIGLLIVLAGLLVGNLAGEAIEKAAHAAGVSYARLVGQGSRATVLLIAVVTAVEQLGIDTAFLTATMTIVIGALTGALALAFALGARAHVGNLIAAHYLRQTYRVGQTVRVAGVEGPIAEITTTAVILDGADGRVLVPASEFGEHVSVLVSVGR